MCDLNQLMSENGFEFDSVELFASIDSTIRGHNLLLKHQIYIQIQPYLVSKMVHKKLFESSLNQM